MVNDHSDSERGNLLLSHGLLFLITSVGMRNVSVEIHITHCMHSGMRAGGAGDFKYTS